MQNDILRPVAELGLLKTRPTPSLLVLYYKRRYNKRLWYVLCMFPLTEKMSPVYYILYSSLPQCVRSKPHESRLWISKLCKPRRRNVYGLVRRDRKPEGLRTWDARALWGRFTVARAYQIRVRVGGAQWDGRLFWVFLITTISAQWEENVLEDGLSVLLLE